MIYVTIVDILLFGQKHASKAESSGGVFRRLLRRLSAHLARSVTAFGVRLD